MTSVATPIAIPFFNVNPWDSPDSESSDHSDNMFQVTAFKRLCTSTVKLLLHNGALAEILQLKVAFKTDLHLSPPNIYSLHLTISPALR